MFEKITKTLSGLAFIKYINSLIDYVNTSDIDATRIKGQLDISNIPPAGLDNVIKVDTVTDMLALTVDDVQNGDTVMIIGVTPPVQYQVVDDTKLGTMDAFQEYAAGTATKALADINGNNIHTTYGKLAGNNTWTGNNYWNGSAIFNANLNIRGSATTPGDSSTYLWLGLKPEGSEQTPSIVRNKQGDLVMYAADYRHCYLKSGIQTSFASVYKSDGTVEFSSLNNTPWGKYTSANGLELTVHKTPTVNNDVPNKKYVDDSVASATADLLSSNNTWTGSNTYNSNIVVKANGTAEVVEGSVYLGRSSKTNQACITGDATGNLYLTNSKDGYTYINNGSNGAAYFGNATIKFYKPTYITNGSSAGSSATLYLGVKPTNETVQARISTDNLGGLFYHASTNQPHVFRIGTNNNVFVIRDDDKKVTFSSNNIPFATVTHDGVAKWLGNANTATKLQTARTINGVSFDGTANITIADSTKLPIAGGTMTGDLTLKGNPTADLMAATKKYVDDSVASATADLLSSNNTWTGSNTYNSNIVVKANGTAEVVEGSVYLGRSSKTNQACITGDATGNLYLTNSKDGYTYINNGSNGAAYFGNATIKFYKPTYITNGSSAGSSATLYLGVKPTNETVQARISTDNLGGLFYHASTNQPHVFRIGTNNNVFVIRDDDKKVTFSSNNIPFATVTHDGVAKWLGNANTATKLQTARTINGVSFDGTANITIADSTKLPIAGGTMTGDLTLKGNPTADLMAATKKYVDDSVASAGGGDVLAAGNNSFTGANTFQNLVTMVGGIVFTSGTTTLAWKNATQIVATINASTYTGNSATATKLATARTITANLASSTAGSFDGSANITVGVTGTLPIANGGTGLTSAPSMLVNLASKTATSPLQASPRPGVTGTLPIANGGTGQTTAAGVRNALGLGNTTGAVPIANGGTGATTAAAARTALGCAPAYTYSTTDLTAGSSALTTGTLYIVYE